MAKAGDVKEAAAAKASEVSITNVSYVNVLTGSKCTGWRQGH